MQESPKHSYIEIKSLHNKYAERKGQFDIFSENIVVIYYICINL